MKKALGRRVSHIQHPSGNHGIAMGGVGLTEYHYGRSPAVTNFAHSNTFWSVPCDIAMAGFHCTRKKTS